MDTRIIVALDYGDAAAALKFVTQVSPQACKLKVGKELFTAEGPQFVEQLVRRGFDVFLDLKFHDIPTTVARACRAAAGLGVWMLNVHALGGAAMVAAAREALGTGADRPLLIAVTVLTSMSDADLREIGIAQTANDMAFRLAGLAHSQGADGVVCSAHEATAIRDAYGDRFLRITPGIRLAGDASDDQKRVMTPEMAMRNGSSYLVIGRSVTKAKRPAEVLQEIATRITPLGGNG